MAYHGSFSNKRSVMLQSLMLHHIASFDVLFDGQWYDEVTSHSQVSSYILYHLDETWHHKKLTT
jgi:hypothetical protein